MEWTWVVLGLPLFAGTVLLVASVGGDQGDGETADTGDVGDGGDGGDADAASNALGVTAEGVGVGRRVMWALGLGSAPLGVVLGARCLGTGGLAVVVHTWLSGRCGEPGVVAGASLVAGALLGVPLAGRVVRTLGRLLPTMETYVVRREDLLGRPAVLVLAAHQRGGLAQVRDGGGDLHQVMVRTRQDSIPAGTDVVLVAFDQTEGTYVVTALHG